MDWTDNKKFYQPQSDIAETEKRKYFKYIGNSGRIWLVADQPNPADNIYVSGGEHSQGFDGRNITFPLVQVEASDPDSITLRGPWHTNSAGLFADTGIDVSDKCYTFVVIGMDREYPQNGLTPITIKDVQYIDEQWELGEFERGDKIAQEIANKLNKTVICFIRSKGGSSHGPVKPNITEPAVDSM